MGHSPYGVWQRVDETRATPQDAPPPPVRTGAVPSRDKYKGKKPADMDPEELQAFWKDAEAGMPLFNIFDEGEPG
eukprot:COSAG01_NODE_14020_length_1506_cov_3.098081_3_plen_74_part_01